MATTKIDQLPTTPGREAGLSAFQSDDYFYAMGVSKNADGGLSVQLHRKAGADDAPDGNIIEEQAVSDDGGTAVYLRIEAKADQYDFSFSRDNENWTVLASDLDGKILSTRTAGGFVGAVFGLYVQPTP
jgi:alpha-N-arabinofuranosidase